MEAMPKRLEYHKPVEPLPKGSVVYYVEMSHRPKSADALGRVRKATVVSSPEEQEDPYRPLVLRWKGYDKAPRSGKHFNKRREDLFTNEEIWREIIEFTFLKEAGLPELPPFLHGKSAENIDDLLKTQTGAIALAFLMPSHAQLRHR